MAIDNFYKSLLSNVKKDNEKNKKDSGTNALKYAAAKLLGKGIKTGLESAFATKRDTFAKNEKIMAEKLKYKSAVNTKEELANEQALILQSGQGGASYYYDQMKPKYKAGLLPTLGLDIAGDERLLDQLIKKQLTPLAEQRAKEQEEGYKLSQSIGTFEEYNTELSSKLDKARPSTVGGAILGGATRLFKGQSKIEQDAEVMSAIRTGDMAKSAEAMQAFDKRYAQTKDVLLSYNFATAIGAEDLEAIANEKATIKVNKTEEVKVVGDQAVKFTTTEKINTITDETETVVTQEAITDFTDSPEGLRDAADAMQVTNNLGKEAKVLLKTSALSNFVAEVQDKLNLNIMNIKTPQEYSEIAGLLSEYITNTSNLVDKFQDGVLTATLANQYTDSASISTLIASLSNYKEGSSEYIAQQKKIQENYNRWNTNAAVAAEYGEYLRSKGITPRSPMAGVPSGLSSTPSAVGALTTNVYKVDPVIWNTLTPADQALLDNADPAAAKAFIDSL